nr:NADH dehydrogenase subunit 1 [Colpocephalum spinicollis]
MIHMMKEMLSNYLSTAQQLMMVVMIMLSVAFFSLMERKILGYIQYRKGPNKILINGFFQPFADAIKLITKDDAPVSWSNTWMFYFSPLLMFFLSLFCWVITPSVWGVFSSKYSFISMIILFGMSVYGVMLSGWSSNSTYAMLGAIRSVSQSISYEVVMSFVILCVMCFFSNYSLEFLYKWKLTLTVMSCPFLFMICFISMLAELNRTPFDMAEGESELVSGYSTEYGGITYTIIFLSENVMIFFSSFVMTFFFFSSLNNILGFFIFSFMTYMICLIRGILPRLRYDVLMTMCWTYLMPIALIVFNFIFLTVNLN